MKNKIIIHMDINYFFAQVEEILNPALKNKPIAVCSNPYKGIILSSNYIARPQGVVAAQKVSEAKKKCKDLILIETRPVQYKLFSQRFFDCIRKNFSEEIEYYSIDEGYIDATELIEKYHNNVIFLVNKIYQTVLYETGLKISIGIGNNKFLAKTANDITDKKLFYNELYKDQIQDKLYDKDINKIFFVGKKTNNYFLNKNIITVGDFINYPNQTQLKEELKSRYDMLMNFFSGNTNDSLDTSEANNKSFSIAETFLYSTSEYHIIKNKIIELSQQLYHKLRMQHDYCKTYVLSIKNENQKAISHSITINKKINHIKAFSNVYIKLLNQYWDCEMVIQISVGANNLYKELEASNIKQLSLFD